MLLIVLVITDVSLHHQLDTLLCSIFKIFALCYHLIMTLAHFRIFLDEFNLPMLIATSCLLSTFTKNKFQKEDYFRNNVDTGAQGT